MSAAWPRVDSPQARQWSGACSRRLHDIEPRLPLSECQALANGLWQIDTYQRLRPEVAADHFLAENLEMMGSLLSST